LPDWIGKNGDCQWNGKKMRISIGQNFKGTGRGECNNLPAATGTATGNDGFMCVSFFPATFRCVLVIVRMELSLLMSFLAAAA
jgi:hypothetical protein